METYLVHMLPLFYKQRTSLNAKIDFNRTGVPLQRCGYKGVTFKYSI